MKTFVMSREQDESGVSGTGDVLEGCVFSDGTVVVRWLPVPSSTVVWDNWEHFWATHVASHPTNFTVVSFSDGTENIYFPQKEQYDIR